MNARVLSYFASVVLVIFYLLPIYTTVNVSLKTTQGLVAGPITPAETLYFGAYVEAFSRTGRAFLNSFMMVLPATLISSFLGSTGGYAFSKFRFKGADILLFLIVLGFYIPPQAILIPLVKFIADIGLFNTSAGLILTHVAYGMPITTLLFKNYYGNIPRDITDSAEVDGAGVGSIYRRIILPLSLPGFAVVTIFQFTNIWNEFLFALTLTLGESSQPVTVAIANLKGTTLAAWNVQMAGAMMGALPVLLFYIFATKLVVKGLTEGAVKG